ncbi:hypothetical protein GIB67_023221 [Kingdonia uniflora]|uniref:Cation efflux protein transmembrane domain-containing protein n=1 Tax=Kingdonia uniflora TaxID=39325 RepID=A0A7J7L9E9_9MAGN|nr:hypothetical protein GIB67_023221 [Kingdonia uniflora]
MISMESPRQHQWSGGDHVGSGGNDRRFAFTRQSSFRQSDPNLLPHTPISIPLLSRTISTIDFPPNLQNPPKFNSNGETKFSLLVLVLSVVGIIRSGNRPMKRLLVMISLNVAYSTAELFIGLLTGRVGLVSDAFHLTFGCGLLTFSLVAMAASRKKPNGVYTYGYKRLEVLAAFTNALFLLFMSFSLAVEALHAFIQDESEHNLNDLKYLVSYQSMSNLREKILLEFGTKGGSLSEMRDDGWHYLIVSAVTNLSVNLLGVWFFRNYARVSVVYRKAEDMNFHSICLHVLADSIRSAGLILASWLLSLGVQNAEVLCLGLVSVAVFMLVIPLFKTTGGILLQIAPNIPLSALNKCLRQIISHEDVSEITQARFWELVPGHVVGTLSIQVNTWTKATIYVYDLSYNKHLSISWYDIKMLIEVKKGIDDQLVLQYVHGLYHDLGVQNLTVQTDSA